MTILKKGSFSLDIGIIKLSGELSEDDRQCAWELYTELSTRVAVTGKVSDDECKDFNGELFIESLDSLYDFFQETRKIMKKYPVGSLKINNQYHLGIMIGKIMSDVLRPFMEKWHVEYRHWWAQESNPRLSPMKRQKEYPLLSSFLEDWSSLRWLSKKLQNELRREYKLININD